MGMAEMMAWGPYGGGKGRGGWGGQDKGLVGRTSKDKLVWIGGFAAKETKDKDLNRELKDHINASGASGCKFVDIGSKGHGGAVFGSAEEATACIAALNGSVFKDVTLEFDAWTKKD